ncbi:MAG: DUF2207 domain-containing protein [Candidatus Altiarchaeota archaeon]|nr:DUF2207 domain-containing protein [Candidatus Altiarchaeota archaeon]
MRISETVRFFLIIFIPLIFFSIITFNKTTPSYTVNNLDMVLDFQPNSLYVEESLTYQINRPVFRELYRSYTMDGALANMQVHEIECPDGTSSYSQNVGNQLELICRSDVSYYGVGTHTVKFRYSIPNPYFCDDEQCILHWKVLDSFSSDISKITMSTENNVNQWMSTPMPELSESGVYTLPGIYKGGLLEIFAVVPLDNKTGGPLVNAENYINEYYGQANTQSFLLHNGNLIMVGMFALELIIILLIFLRVSKEHSTPEIPEILHQKPSDRKPSEVSFLFGNRPGSSIHPNAIDATLLDLARRGYIKIEKDKISVLKRDEKLDELELKLIDFYGEYGDIADFKTQIKKMGSWKLRMLSLKIDGFTRPLGWLKTKFNSIYDRKGKRFVWLNTVVFLLLGFILNYVSRYSFPKFWIFLVSQIPLIVLILLLDNYVFGRYSIEGVREKRRWEAFENLLKDTAQMQKYEPEDLSMWGDWLVFATVFGCADKVLKRLKAHNVKLPYIPSYGTRFYFYSSIRSSAHTQLATKVGRSVGSFSGGVGGGFGGGGGGAR